MVASLMVLLSQSLPRSVSNPLVRLTLSFEYLVVLNDRTLNFLENNFFLLVTLSDIVRFLRVLINSNSYR